MSNLVANIQ